MWEGDADPVWSAHPQAARQSFPNLSLAQGRRLLKQIHQLGPVDVGADAEIDIVQPGTPLAEFHPLSMAALGPAAVKADALTAEQVAALVDRPRLTSSADVSYTSASGGAGAAQRSDWTHGPGYQP
jgi:hypothetical protein